jgi:uncharacterized protein
VDCRWTISSEGTTGERTAPQQTKNMARFNIRLSVFDISFTARTSRKAMTHLSTTGTNSSYAALPIPAKAGIGLRGPHMVELLRTAPDVGWLEVHSENFFGDGGAPITCLLNARRDYPISLHGVGMSLGSVDPLNMEHLASLQHLIDLVEPGLISEHLSWSSIDGVYFNDLLPLPYTEEALIHFCERVDRIQDNLGRSILIENPSSYLSYRHSVIPEWEFISEINRRTGAGLLLDVNNLLVSAFNLRFDPLDYLAEIPAEQVMEIHLAGHTEKTFPDGKLLIDDHASPVCDAVWELYARTLDLTGPKPTLIEWDADLPPLAELVGEAATARNYLEACDERIV